MQEIFYEETAKMQNMSSGKRKYYIAKVLMIISYTIACIWFLFCLFYVLNAESFLSSLLYSIIPFILFLASGIFLGKMKDKLYVDYDYTFVTGSLRFSKVINNYKRKHILNVEAKEIEKIGFFGSESYERYVLSPDLKPKILTSNNTPEEGKDLYYIVANSNGEKNLLVLECSELFIVNILKYTSKSILDEELLKQKKTNK